MGRLFPHVVAMLRILIPDFVPLVCVAFFKAMSHFSDFKAAIDFGKFHFHAVDDSFGLDV